MAGREGGGEASAPRVVVVVVEEMHRNSLIFPTEYRRDFRRVAPPNPSDEREKRGEERAEYEMSTIRRGFVESEKFVAKLFSLFFGIN